MKIKITADSTCDLAREYVEKHDVRIIPLKVNLNGRDYSDGEDITPEDIFREVGRGCDLPKTSAINTEEFRKTFRALLKDYDAIIHFDISSDFSSCYANAVVASEGLPVYCIDSRNLSTGIGLLIAEAVDMVEAGCEDPAAIVDHVKSLTDRVDASFILDRLDYLHKGGRCSTVAMLGANVLKLKPCIEVVDGRMIVGKKYRGQFARCVRQYIEDHLKDLNAIDGKRIFLVHTGFNAQLTDDIKAELAALNYFGEILEARAGSTISSHCGDTTLGIMYLRKAQ